jgi:hypothetical protein
MASHLQAKGKFIEETLYSHLIVFKWQKFWNRRWPGQRANIPTAIGRSSTSIPASNQRNSSSSCVEEAAHANRGARPVPYCCRGQSLVVWAFNEGRGAARECDRFLMGYTDLP